MRVQKDNLKNWILKEAKDEDIEAVVIGNMGWHDFNKEKSPHFDEIPFGKVLPWKEASKFIDYEFDSGYGSPECNAIYAWTKTKVIFISQYDGSTCINSIPRNPQECEPYMPGG